MTSQRVLNGRYELGELLGRGGMADVYKGVDTVLGRTVAVKLLRADLARDPQFHARFKREAQAVAALNHSSIVAIYDTGEYTVFGGPGEDVRVPYIVMEYVSGRTVRDLIRAKELDIDQAIEFILGVLAALEYSHKAGIVHRDIKPANVMVTGESNDVKVMDFGIARAMADSAATMTQTQAVVGTAQYLSPEQALGETVDARSDLYSAACLLFEMLTSRPPFTGDSPVSVAYQHVREIPEPASTFNPAVSEALDSVLAKGLQKNRADRFQDAAAFRRALRAAKNGVAVPALAAGTPTDVTEAVPLTQPIPEGGLARGLVGAEVLDSTLSGGPENGLAAGGQDMLAREAAESEAEHDGAMPLGFAPERERTARQKSRRRAWTAVVVILVLLVLAGGGFWVYSTVNQKPTPPPLIAVPAVAGMSEATALQTLYGANLSPESHHVPDDKVPKGTVISTDPGVGSQVAPKSHVMLNVSDGPVSATVPAGLSGLTEAAARDLLRQAGLVGGSSTLANSATVPAGSVISTKPASGAVVGVGSTVDLVVSTGKVAVPQLVGLSEADAEALLKANGLAIAVTEQENSQVTPGKVTGQGDAFNSLVEQGKTISVIVAKAPAPPPSPTPTPTPSPSDTKGGGGLGGLGG
ncbi:serine/threonine-protein kinase [Arthrobacter bambusae]|uniref:non-specific serine/threonine protein kinase n=2 Tax=Arthrobacter bambusae TaxID=1338426 RepID=A0AAW8DDC2_9MICC|nr:Stk1 family PASTA domain-containing Ser/Thr kinase [Arthrobacter bambusae]MDP9906836.1 serine/threonine-protein kinase [Arthrobacter bambusae]MDQ0130992.1 serine/threonine-protein kinase [Arthrobacter bambusae]MDQ0182514.1 serine/threonine-protein kinase [Arthrobacter bambusae]